MEDGCDTRLALGLRLRGGGKTASTPTEIPNSRQQVGPSLTLCLSDDHIYPPSMFRKAVGETSTLRPARLSSPHSTVSSFSTSNIKKENNKDGSVREEVEVDRGFSRASDEEEEAGARKKLRLTKEQSALLEDRFKEHSTLNPKLKQALARQLNLRPRQVEVWFQNRRARTKLKQTEVDYELLKRCFETLTEENRRLHKELQEIKALKFSAPALPLYMQLPAATLSICPSCDRIAESVGSVENNSKVASTVGGPFLIATKLQQNFFNPFTHSAAC